MSALLRYAAAIAHLGPRQTALNLLHRVRARTRRFGRYARTGRGLEWRGQPRVPLLAHAGGARLLGSRFTAIGRDGDVGDPPRWDADEPLLWLYNLHYFGWLGELPAPEQRRLVLDWIERYPPERSRPGWWPYPLSLRLRHWLRALHDGGALAAERARVLASVEMQAECLADTLEHHLRGNHLLESAITLKLVAACARGPAAARWERLADRTLDAELPEQFLLDGGHFERSPMYHALLVHGLLDLANLLPDDDERRVKIVERLPSLLHFLGALTHPDGEIALFNDAAFGIAPETRLLFDYADRLGLKATAAASGSFPETGYHVWRHGGDALFVDAGPIGPEYLSTHGHGDMFSWELSLDGRRVVVDGGTSTYAESEERSWARSTRAHNTLEVAGQDQCEFFGAFRVGRRGRPRNVEARVSERELLLSGWHDGYRRLPGQPVHRRELAWDARGALAVWDRVDSSVPHAAVSRVRFAPGAEVAVTSADSAAIVAWGQRLSLRCFGAALRLEPGFYAPRFGERVACPVLALDRLEGPELGYLLAKGGLGGSIDAVAASVFGELLPRPGARRAAAERP